MRKQLAILGGKAAGVLSRAAGKGGSNIPGVVARKMDPAILKRLATQAKTTILVTGTNGKTTTSQLLASILRAAGKTVVHNAEGANLITGITSCFVEAQPIVGAVSYDFAVIETDEATVSKAVKELTPDIVVVTNFFRDQLDRFGEIDILLNRIIDDLTPVPTKLVLNGDDPFTCRLSVLQKETVYFGIHREAFRFDQHEMAESKFCPACGSELCYDHIHYGQLGYFRCGCGNGRPDIQYELKHLQANGSLSLSVNEPEGVYELAIGGVFNAANALAALAAAKEAGIEEAAIQQGLASYHSENGRMQSLRHGGVTHCLNLFKNPAGLNLTLSEILYSEGPVQAVFFLNDLSYDGRDISWIWDGDFERLCCDKIERIFCSGLRAEELSVRLKYAGVDPVKVVVIEDKEEAVLKALAHKIPTYFVPNYTALEPVRKQLRELEDKEGSN